MQTFTPDAIVVNGKMLRGMSLTVDGDRIAALEAKIGGEPVAGVIVPGFVDTHVHGGGGADFAGDPETAIKVHRWAGSTSIIASLVSAPIEDLIAQVRQLRSLVEAGELAGIHLEGPFLSPERAGAHRVDALSLPTPTAVNALLQAGGDALSMVTLAPELPGALEAIDAFIAAGVRVALGHTNATRDHASAAFAHGATIVTHAFNAMAGIHHREPGLLPLALTDPRILIEVIPDGHHVHRDVVDLLRACAPGRVALVTDAMAGACMQDGAFDLGGQSVDVVDGVARTSDGELAGSTLTMARAFETVRGWRWCWSEAVSATSSAPSRWHRGIGRGGLTVGSRADFCVVDTHGRLNNVMYGGNWTLGEAMFRPEGGAMSGDLIDTTEMYLRTIIELEEEGVTPLRARIAERLEQSSPTVSQTVSRMERDGLLAVHGDRRIGVSEAGRQRGLEVMRRHRLAERFLVEILQLPLHEVHEEACRWEHVMSPLSEERMFAVLKEPTMSPYGTPIPALAALGYADEVPAFLDGVVRLSEATATKVTIRRFSENVQRDHELLGQLVDAHILPGVPCECARSDVGIKLTSEQGSCVVSFEDAADIFVS